MQKTKMQWYFLILLTAWIFVPIILAVIVLCITHNLYTLSVISISTPPVIILIRITKHLFPRSEEEIKLDADKAKYKAERVYFIAEVDRERYITLHSLIPLDAGIKQKEAG